MNDQQTSTGSAGAGKYLTFSIAAERYGLDILRVQEIIGITHITNVPRAPACIKGVINLRGKIIPVVDLRTKFGIERVPYDEKTCIIVVHLERAEQQIAVGLIVDTVLEVIEFQPCDVEPCPNYGGVLDSRFITGIGKRDSHPNILIDINLILNEVEVVEIVEHSSETV